MRRLLLLRHAKAEPPDGHADAQRPLAERGRGDAPRMGREMARAGLVPDLALVSSAVRTQETWQLLAPQLDKDVTAREESRLYAASEMTLLELVRQAADEVRTLLLCGHNPGLERLARSFAKSGEPDAIRRLQQKYPTCGLAVIDLPANAWKEIEPPAGRLEIFLTPKIFAD